MEDRTSNELNSALEEGMPTMEEILAAQKHVSEDTKARLRLETDADGTLRNRQQKVYVPDKNGLRVRLFVVGHQGTNAHRGTGTTLDEIARDLWWETITLDVGRWCNKCLSCMKTKGGKVVPRPMLSMERATRPNELLTFDFTTVRLDDTPGVPQHLLVVMDNFSRYVRLYPSLKADADAVTRAMVDWFAAFGICTNWVSDRGSHFANDVMKRLAEAHGINHHFTLARAPWSNGMVERVNRNLRELLSATMLDVKARDCDWEDYVPLVAHAINSAPSSALGGITPFEAFLGRKSVGAMQVVTHGEYPRLVAINPLKTRDAVARLREDLDNLHSLIRSHQSRSGKDRGRVTPVNFGVGDFVLVSRAAIDDNLAKDKTRPIWHGPMQVIRQEGPRGFEVEDLQSGLRRVVHATFLKRCGGSGLKLTKRVMEAAAHGGRGFVVEEILSHCVQQSGREKIVLMEVRWEGGDISFEPLRRLNRDVPREVKRYLSKLQPSVKQVLLQLTWPER